MYTFSKGDRVCFVGDSITHLNFYLSYIVMNYRKKYPDNNVEFYNCGVSGGTLSTALALFNEDVLIHNPTHVVLMIGINDSNRGELELKGKQKYDNLYSAFSVYKSNLNTFEKLLKSYGIKLIICTPAPYAEYQKTNQEPFHGGYALMQGYAEYLRNFARENGYPICDYFNFLTKVMCEEDLYGNDHVHPTNKGHYYMAKCFLEFLGVQISEELEFTPEIQKWHNVTIDYRNVVAIEHFLLDDDFSVPHEERFEIIKNYIPKDHSKENHAEYFMSLALPYVDNKPRQTEMLKFLRDFMKNNIEKSH